MKIYGINRHGGKSNSDIFIYASGEGFNELDMFCDAVLKMYPKTEGVGLKSTYANVRQIAKELQQMIHPLNNNPKHFFTTEKKEKL